MTNNFNKQEFMEWLKNEFPECLNNHWNWDIVDNVIDYGLKHNNVSKDQLCYFLNDLIPEVEFSEVARFCDDSILTRDTLRNLEGFRIKTESYIYGNEEFVEVGKKYYFGQLWDGNGEGEELLESGSIAMWDEIAEEEKIVEFEIIEKDEDIFKTWLKVLDIF